MNAQRGSAPAADLTGRLGDAPQVLYPNPQTLRVLNVALDEPTTAKVREMLMDGTIDRNALKYCFEAAWCYWLSGKLAISPGGRAMLGGGGAR